MDKIIGYCAYCKCMIQPWDKFKITSEGMFHNNDINDCYELSRNFMDDFGDNCINDEE